MIEKRKTQAIITFCLLAASVIWMVASRREVESKQYDLINVKSGGKLYSNVDGIKTDGKEFTWYLVGLGGTALFGILHLMCVADLIDRKKKQKKNGTEE